MSRDTSEASPLRRRQLDVTRNAVLDAARALFTELGYPATSVRRLAEEAEVGVQTIYRTFGSKPGVLLAMLDQVDSEVVEPVVRELHTTDDPRQLTRLMAALERRVREAGADVMRLVLQAAAVDEEAAAVWEQGFNRHREGVARVCRKLDASGALRKGLSVDEAVATTMALTSVEAYEEQVRHEGWSHDRYEEWLAGALAHALLARR